MQIEIINYNFIKQNN